MNRTQCRQTYIGPNAPRGCYRVRCIASGQCMVQKERISAVCDHAYEPLIDMADVITLRCRKCGMESESE